MRVRNLLDVAIQENFYGHGLVRMDAGEVKEIPDACAKCWMDEKRMGRKIIEEAEGAVPVDKPVDTVDEPEKEPVKAEPKKTQRKVARR